MNDAPTGTATTPLSTEEILVAGEVAARLEARFDGTFNRATIERYIVDSRLLLEQRATVRRWLPLMVERFAEERLRALARLQGTPPERPAVLFLCVHNAGRSQMAAGWLRQLVGDSVDVFSGGSEPAEATSSAAMEVMAEVGVDLRSEFPKPWTDEVARAADVIVSMGCGDACPILPGKRYEEWDITDPNGRTLDEVRSIRDDIRRRVETLATDLVAPTSA